MEQIGAELSERGIPAESGRSARWDHSSVRRILRGFTRSAGPPCSVTVRLTVVTVRCSYRHPKNGLHDSARRVSDGSDCSDGSVFP